MKGSISNRRFEWKTLCLLLTPNSSSPNTGNQVVGLDMTQEVPIWGWYWYIPWEKHRKRLWPFNVYLFLGQRETEHERGRGRERGRHRIRNRIQALSHQPRARRRARTHGPRDRDLAEVGRPTDCATQAPLERCFLKSVANEQRWERAAQVSLLCRV